MPEEKKSYFTVEEMCVSGSYPKLATIPPENSIQRANIQYTIDRLNIIREKWGGPIIVTSGYRPEKLNKAVGGSATSAHLTGMAADIHPKYGNILLLAQTIIESGVDFDQLILEKITKDANGYITSCQWLHVGFARKNPRKQILCYDGKSYRPMRITKEMRFRDKDL